MSGETEQDTYVASSDNPERVRLNAGLHLVVGVIFSFVTLFTDLFLRPVFQICYWNGCTWFVNWFFLFPVIAELALTAFMFVLLFLDLRKLHRLEATPPRHHYVDIVKIHPRPTNSDQLPRAQGGGATACVLGAFAMAFMGLIFFIGPLVSEYDCEGFYCVEASQVSFELAIWSYFLMILLSLHAVGAGFRQRAWNSLRPALIRSWTPLTVILAGVFLVGFGIMNLAYCNGAPYPYSPVPQSACTNDPFVMMLFPPGMFLVALGILLAVVAPRRERNRKLVQLPFHEFNAVMGIWASAFVSTLFTLVGVYTFVLLGDTNTAWAVNLYHNSVWWWFLGILSGAIAISLLAKPLPSEMDSPGRRAQK